MTYTEPTPGGRTARELQREAKRQKYIRRYVAVVQGRLVHHAPPPLPVPMEPHPGCALRLCPLCAARKA
jgi:hypothetical protein